MLYITNVFSLLYLKNIKEAMIERINKSLVKEILKEKKWQSAINNQEEADAISVSFGIKIPYNNLSLSLKEGDELLCIVPLYYDDVGLIEALYFYITVVALKQGERLIFFTP